MCRFVVGHTKSQNKTLIQNVKTKCSNKISEQNENGHSFPEKKNGKLVRHKKGHTVV
jgi:hypothetical protein